MELDPDIARPELETDAPETLRCGTPRAEPSLTTVPAVLAQSVELQASAGEQEHALTTPARLGAIGQNVRSDPPSHDDAAWEADITSFIDSANLPKRQAELALYSYRVQRKAMRQQISNNHSAAARQREFGSQASTR